MSPVFPSNSLKISKATVRWLSAGLVFMLAVSAYLVSIDETETVLAWWLAVLLLLPGVLMAGRTRLVSIRVFCFTAFATQFVTLPCFFLEPDRYAFAQAKPFGFNGVSVWPIFFPLGVFLVLVVFFSQILARGFGGSAQRSKCMAYSPALSGGQTSREMDVPTLLTPAKKHWFYVGAIVLVVAMMTPVNLWMFSNSIGLTGVESPKLPFHLSGILFYFSRYIIPALLGYLYTRTRRRSLLLALFLVGYALVLGVSGTSKGSVLFVAGPVLLLAWMDKRILLFVLTSLATLSSLSCAIAAKDFVYSIAGGKTTALTSSGVFGTLFYILALKGVNTHYATIFSGILGRIESFDSLVLASQFDSSAIGGPVAVVLNTISYRLAQWDHVAYHTEWQGFAPPEGFFSGGSFLARVLMASNFHMVIVGLMAVLVAVELVALESSAYAVARRFGFRLGIVQACVAFFTLLYFTAPGSNDFVTPLLALNLLRVLLPVLRLQRRAKMGLVQPISMDIIPEVAGKS